MRNEKTWEPEKHIGILDARGSSGGHSIFFDAGMMLLQVPSFQYYENSDYLLKTYPVILKLHDKVIQLIYKKPLDQINIKSLIAMFGKAIA